MCCRRTSKCLVVRQAPRKRAFKGRFANSADASRADRDLWFLMAKKMTRRRRNAFRRNASRELHRNARFETFEEKLALSAQPVGDFFLEQHTGPQLEHHYGDLAPAESVAPIGDFNLNLGVPSQVDDASRGVQTQLREAHDLTGVNDAYNTYGFDGFGQTVAIIDSGIAYDHVALGGGFGTSYRVVGGWDFAENDANPYDDGPAGFHGTHVAGIVGSDDATHRGVASGADLVALRVFDDNGAGYFNWVEDALQWVHDNRDAFENPITTVNLSLGTSWNADSIPSWAMLEDEFAQLEQDGLFISVSAGNSFEDYNLPGLSYPASSSHVVPVASVDDSGLLSYFSQRNDRVLAAPGRSITSTVPDYIFGTDGNPNDFGTASGTSMAAPYTAGASVLVRQAMEFVGSQNITQDTIYDHFRATADVVYDAATSASYHRINVQAAIDALMPTDDYGSDAAGAFDLGTLIGNSTLSGQFDTVTDQDFFAFTAGETGTITFTIDTNNVTAVDAQLIDGTASLQDNVLTFDVDAGQSYIVSFGAIGQTASYDVGIALAQAAFTIKEVEHNGHVHTLDSNGLLSVDGVQLRSQTQDFSVSGNGTLYWLGTNGNLERQTEQGWQVVAQDVVKYVVHEDNTVYSLDTDHWVSANGRHVWRNTEDFNFADDGSLYWHSTGGHLQRRFQGRWQTIGRDVTKYVVHENTVYSLQTDHWLSVSGGHAWTGTADFDFASDGSLYWLSVGGHLQRRFEGRWETIERGVAEFQLENTGGISYQRTGGGTGMIGDLNSTVSPSAIRSIAGNTVQAIAGSFQVAPEKTNFDFLSKFDFLALDVDSTRGFELAETRFHDTSNAPATEHRDHLMRMVAAIEDSNAVAGVLGAREFTDSNSAALAHELAGNDELELVDAIFDEFATPAGF